MPRTFDRMNYRDGKPDCSRDYFHAEKAFSDFEVIFAFIPTHFRKLRNTPFHNPAVGSSPNSGCFVLGGEGYGTGQTQWYDLANNGHRTTMATQGDKAIEGTNAPGFKFVPGIDKLVPWAGGEYGTPRLSGFKGSGRVITTRHFSASGRGVTVLTKQNLQAP